MSKEVGCHITRFSTAARTLIELGYLRQEPHSLNKRMRAYRVIYDPNDTLPNGKQLGAPTDCGAAKYAGPTPCQPKCQISENDKEIAANIFRETEDLKSCEKSLAADQEALPAETRLDLLIQRFVEGGVDLSVPSLEAFVSEVEVVCAGSTKLEQRARETKQRAYGLISAMD